MSLELSVKLPSSIPFDRLTAEVLRRVQLSCPTAPTPTWEERTDSLGARPWHVRALLGGNDEVILVVFSAGPESHIGHDGGWWATTSAARTAGSIVLMLMVAATLAELAGTMVEDEEGIFKFGSAFWPATAWDSMPAGCSSWESFTDRVLESARARPR